MPVKRFSLKNSPFENYRLISTQRPDTVTVRDLFYTGISNAKTLGIKSLLSRGGRYIASTSYTGCHGIPQSSLPLVTSLVPTATYTQESSATDLLRGIMASAGTDLLRGMKNRPKGK